MYNIAISVGLGCVMFGAVSLWLGPVAAVLPALLIFGLTLFFASRRVGRAVEAEMAALVPLLQQRKTNEAKALITSIQERYGKWQILLDKQLDAQVGMIDYLQLKFSDALPRLERGKFRNWSALVCIGAIHYRQDRRDAAWDALDRAANAASKEAIIYLVWATLKVRSGDRAEALAVLDRGLKANPNSEQLKNLRKRVANKRKIDTKQFPQTWYQFFPEELATQMLMRGRRTGPGPGQAAPQPKFGAGSMRRR
jgi:tetratricopeptide (TPR) repeat protein